MNEENLTIKAEDFMIEQRAAGNEDMTANDLFDYLGVEMSLRSDFALSAIMKDVDWERVEAQPIQGQLF